MTAVSEEGVVHKWTRHCRACPGCDRAYDGASLEGAAAAWLAQMPCPCGSIAVLLCAGCGAEICYIADRARGVCEHYGMYGPS